MHADAHFVKGRSHRICEDYALAGMIDGRPFVVLCDGCSSSPHTDFGARILAHSFKDVLATLQSARPYSLPALALAQAHVRAQSSGLDITSLDCTLLAAWVDNDRVYTTQTGDGGIVYKHRDGRICIQHTDFAGGAPYYPSYSLDLARRERYHSEYHEGATRSVHNAPTTGAFVSEERPRVIDEGGWLTSVFCESVTAVGVFSDGLFTFRNRKTLEQEDMKHVLREMVSFKTPRGEFVQRRMKRVLRDYAKDNIEPEDDVSLAAIHL